MRIAPAVVLDPPLTMNYVWLNFSIIEKLIEMTFQPDRLATRERSRSPLPTIDGKDTFQISVMTQAGQAILVNVDRDTTLKDVMNFLDGHEGICCEGKSLMQKPCNRFMDMEMLEIVAGDRLYLVDGPPVKKPLLVRLPTGRTLSLQVLPSDDIESIKKQIQRSEGIDFMRLTLDLEDGRRLSDYSTPGDVYYVNMMPLYDTPRTPPGSRHVGHIRDI